MASCSAPSRRPVTFQYGQEPARRLPGVDLDDPRRFQELDPGDYLSAIGEKADLVARGHEAGRQAAKEAAEQAAQQAAEQGAPAGTGAVSPTGLLFAGMGFSGVGANLVKDACTRVMDLPFSIVKHYQFPNHVKPGWHTLAVSYSGETEETLTVARESVRRGVPVTGFTTGGALAELADVVVPQPPGYQPRAAFAYTWSSILGFLEGSDLLHETVPVEAAVAAVREADARYGADAPEDKNEAKQLAGLLWEKVPQIYATPAFYGVGLHFRGMLNENAKKIADVDLVPECNHNDLTGWGDDPNREHFCVLAISHGDQNPQIMRRLAYMEKRYEEWGLNWHHIVARPVHSFSEHVVEQARALQFLDYTSYYVAMLRGVDPSEIREIQGLKAFLRDEAALQGR